MKALVEVGEGEMLDVEVAEVVEREDEEVEVALAVDEGVVDVATEGVLGNHRIPVLSEKGKFASVQFRKPQAIDRRSRKKRLTQDNYFHYQ